MIVLNYSDRDVDRRAWDMIGSREPFDVVVEGRAIRRLERAFPVLRQHLEGRERKRGLKFLVFAAHCLRSPVFFVLVWRAMRVGMIVRCQRSDEVLLIRFRRADV